MAWWFDITATRRLAYTPCSSASCAFGPALRGEPSPSTDGRATRGWTNLDRTSWAGFDGPGSSLSHAQWRRSFASTRRSLYALPGQIHACANAATRSERYFTVAWVAPWLHSANGSSPPTLHQAKWFLHFSAGCLSAGRCLPTDHRLWGSRRYEESDFEHEQNSIVGVRAVIWQQNCCRIQSSGIRKSPGWRFCI